MKSVTTNLLVYWPDGAFKLAPRDGFVYTQNPNDTYTWDGLLEVWVSGYGGKIVDFTPPGQPSKVIQTNIQVPSAIDFIPLSITIDNPDDVSKCECGSEKLGHPGHSTWCKKWSKS